MNFDERRLKAALPLPPEVYPAAITFANSITTSVTAAAYTSLWQPMEATPAAVEYAQALIKTYEALQQRHQRPVEARQHLTRIAPSLGAYFDLARDAAGRAEAGVAQPASAANEMRNLLVKFKGELLDLARRSRGDKVSWSTMAGRLLSRGAQMRDRDHVRQQENVHATLCEELTPILKRWSETQPALLPSMWTRTVDHLYVVAGPIVGAEMPAIQGVVGETRCRIEYEQRHPPDGQWFMFPLIHTSGTLIGFKGDHLSDYGKPKAAWLGFTLPEARESVLRFLEGRYGPPVGTFDGAPIRSVRLRAEADPMDLESAS